MAVTSRSTTSPGRQGAVFLLKGDSPAPGQHTAVAVGGAGQGVLEDGGGNGREAFGFAVIDHLREGVLFIQRDDAAVQLAAVRLDSDVILLAYVISWSQHGPLPRYLVIETRLRASLPYKTRDHSLW